MKTTKLTKAEWTSLIMAVVGELGVDPVRAAVERALGKERTDALADRKERIAVSKEDTRRIVRELYPVIPGVDRDAKIDWVLGIMITAFPDAVRRKEIVAYAMDRVASYEAAGGTLDAPVLTTKHLWSGVKGWKGSGLGIDHTGRIVEVIYNNATRKNVEVWVEGKKIAALNAETGNVFFDEARVFLSMEKGTPSELTDGGIVPFGFGTTYSGCGIIIDGLPHWLDEDAGGPPLLKNISGDVVATFPGRGIPYAAAVAPDGDIAVAVCDGAEPGLAFRSKGFIPCDVRGLCASGGRLYAGIAGRLAHVTDGNLVYLTDKLADSIDSICEDGEGGLFLATSAPDQLIHWVGGSSKILDSFDDDPDGGALFRSRVAHRNGRTVWGRNDNRAGNVWSVYEAEQ